MKTACSLCGLEVKHVDMEKIATCGSCVNKLMVCPQDKLIKLWAKCNEKELTVKARTLASFIHELPDSQPSSPYGQKKQLRLTRVKRARFAL